MADFFNDQYHNRERENGPEGEPGVNPNHHRYGSAVYQDGIYRTHDAKTGQHTDVGQIIGKAGENITAATAGKVTEVKPGEALEQVVTDAKFGNSGRIQNECPGKDAGDAVQDCQERYDQSAC